MANSEITKLKLVLTVTSAAKLALVLKTINVLLVIQAHSYIMANVSSHVLLDSLLTQPISNAKLVTLLVLLVQDLLPLNAKLVLKIYSLLLDHVSLVKNALLDNSVILLPENALNAILLVKLAMVVLLLIAYLVELAYS